MLKWIVIAWMVTGQTYLYRGQVVDNPPANQPPGLLNGYRLPYVVPDDCELHLKSIGMESYNVGVGAGIFPWLGEPPATNPAALMTVFAGQGTNEITGATFILEAGTRINARLMNASQANVYGWYLGGELRCLVPDGDE